MTWRRWLRVWALLIAFFGGFVCAGGLWALADTGGASVIYLIVPGIPLLLVSWTLWTTAGDQR